MVDAEEKSFGRCFTDTGLEPERAGLQVQLQVQEELFLMSVPHLAGAGQHTFLFRKDRLTIREE